MFSISQGLWSRTKRARFIDESVEVRETFGFASPSEVLDAVKLYCGSHYGSMVWSFDSDMAKQYFNALREAGLAGAQGFLYLLC